MQTKVPSRLVAITRGQSSYEVSTRSDPAAGAGVVDKHVESAEFVDQQVDGHGTRRQVGCVELLAESLAAVGLHFLSNGVGTAGAECHVIPTSMPVWASATAVALPMPESEAVTSAYRGSKVMRQIFPAILRTNRRSCN
jgi:hypothetical protein